MDRKDMVRAAGLLGIKKNLKSEEMLEAIKAKLVEINKTILNKPDKPSGGKLPVGKKPEDGRRGFHPITGLPR